MDGLGDIYSSKAMVGMTPRLHGSQHVMGASMVWVAERACSAAFRSRGETVARRSQGSIRQRLGTSCSIGCLTDQVEPGIFYKHLCY